MVSVSINRCLLRDRRLQAGYTQKQLARYAGVSYSRISEYENGAKNMSTLTLKKFAYILDCSMDDIYEFNIVDSRQ